MTFPLRGRRFYFHFNFIFAKKTKMFTNFFGKESGSLFQKQLLILWRTILFSIEGSFHRYRGPPPSRREAALLTASTSIWQKIFTNSFAKVNYAEKEIQRFAQANKMLDIEIKSTAPPFFKFKNVLIMACSSGLATVSNSAWCFI